MAGGQLGLLFVISCVSRSVCAFVNLLSLIFSAPFVTCSADVGKGNERCQKKFVWFVVIICVDFLISILYTIQFIARIEYAIYLRVQKDRVRGFIGLYSTECYSNPLSPSAFFLSPKPGGEARYSQLTSWYRLINLTLVTVSLWWSVVIGVSRYSRRLL